MQQNGEKLLKKVLSLNDELIQYWCRRKGGPFFG